MQDPWRLIGYIVLGLILIIIVIWLVGELDEKEAGALLMPFLRRLRL